MTVATELARDGSRLRYFIKIDGIEHIFWQEGERHDGGGNPVGCDPPGGHPVADPSLVALWPFDVLVAGQDAADVIGDHTATATGSPAPAQGLVGKLYRNDTTNGAAGTFSNANYYSAADAATLRPNRLTIACFIYVASTTQFTDTQIVNKEYNAAGGSVGLTFITGDSTPRFGFYDDTPTLYTADGTAALAVGWHHLAGTYDGAALKLYVDGALVAETAAVSKTIRYDAFPWFFGGHSLSSLYLAGRLDDAAIYSEAKSAEWIRRASNSGDYSRRGLACLQVPEGELSSGIDLKEGVSTLSKMDFRLRNIFDPYTRDRTRYFAKLFAPGRPSQSDVATTNLRRPTATTLQLDADATSIYVADGGVTNFDSSGVAHIGQETFAYTGTTADVSATGFTASQNVDRFDGCIKGIWPALRSSPRGRTFPYPYEVDDAAGSVGSYHLVSSQPYSLIGREVGLYVQAWDPANAKWFSESAAELLWAGTITQEVNCEDGYWRIGADSILDSLSKKVGRHFPRGFLDGINYQGPRGLSFRVGIISGTTRYDGTIALTGGFNSLNGLIADVTAALNNSSNWSPSGPGVFNILDNDGKLQIDCIVPNAQVNYLLTLSAHEDGPCHPLQALGFFRNRGGGGDEIPLLETATTAGRAQIDADTEPYPYYHPVHTSANGGEIRMYWEGNDQPWDDQGDNASALAWMICRDQPIWGYEHGYTGRDEHSAYVVGYNSKTVFASTTTYDYTIETNPALAASLGGITDYRLNDGGFIGSHDEPLELQQVYIPAYSPNASGFRGPIELLLYPLLSSGTTDYNDSTYDKLPLPLSIDVPIEVVDWESFVAVDTIARNLSPDLARRPYYIIDEPTEWIELWKREAKLFGLVLVWSRGKLTAKSLRTFAEAELAETTITTASMAGIDEYPPVSISPANVINQFEIVPKHPLVREVQRPIIVANDVGSQHGLGATYTVRVEHPGLGKVDPGELLEKVINPRLWLFRYPHQAVRVTLHRSLYRYVEPGDWVTYQASDHPDPFGSGTMSCNAKAYVLNRGFVPNRGVMYADLLIMSAFDLDDAAPWAAAAVVDIDATNAGWDSSNKILTLVAHTYGDSSTDDHDGEAFVAGHECYVQESTPEDPTSVTRWGPWRVLGYTSGSRELELEAGTTLGGFDTTGDTEYVVVAADYGDASVGQRLLGTWGASVTTQLLNGSVAAQRWG